MATLNFDSTNVKPAEAAEAIPAGEYLCAMVSSEMKPTLTGTGSYLLCGYEVLDGTYKGRKLFDRINRTNPNPVAVEIGNAQLSAVCHATGVIQVQDSAQFHGIPMVLKVKVRPAQTAEQSGDGKPHDASNEVVQYSSANRPGMQPQQNFAPPPAAQAPAAWAPSAPPQSATTQLAAQPQPGAMPPWAAVPAQAPAQQPVPVQQPVQPQAPAAVPPWQAQPAQPQPGAMPPWAQPQQ